MKPLLFILLGLLTPAFGGEITTMVIGKYDKNSPATTSATPRRIDPVVTVRDPGLLTGLAADLQDSKLQKISWYMYDAIPVYFLDADGRLVAALEYWPVTKPTGGFRPLPARQEGGYIIAEVTAPADRRGYLLPALADLIDAKAPPGLVWPEKASASN